MSDPRELTQHVTADQLTEDIGGSFKYDHEAWVKFVKVSSFCLLLTYIVKERMARIHSAW